MPRQERAKQFAPFDALKGLQEALRMKEYEHERQQKGDVPEEKILEISANLQKIDKSSLIEIKYFFDGYEKNYSGRIISIDLIFQTIRLTDKISVNFSDILDLKLL